jgi:hypothetical protein
LVAELDSSLGLKLKSATGHDREQAPVTSHSHTERISRAPPNYLKGTPESLLLLIPKPTIGYDPEAVPDISIFITYFPKIRFTN